MTFSQKALQVLKTVAPMLATATLGPFGPLAAAAITAALGTAPGDQKAAETALLGSTPDQLLALKKADSDFQEQMRQLGIEEEQLVYEDIANARARQSAVKDRTPEILAYAITVGFFSTLAYLIDYGKPHEGGDVLLVLLGALGTAWTGVVGYYFGSSAGSASKTDTINKIAAKGT